MVKTVPARRAISSLLYDIRQKMDGGSSDQELIEFTLLRAKRLYKSFRHEEKYNRHHTMPPIEALHDTHEEPQWRYE